MLNIANISMARATTASSLIYHHKLFNFSSTHSPIPHTLNFPLTTTTSSSKPLILNPQLLNPPSFKLHPLHPPSFSLHQFEYTEEEENDPKTETKTLPNSDPKSSQSKRLFVGNLPFSLSSSQLAQLFAEAGNVVSVEIAHDDIGDRSRGFAFVTMGSVEDAEEAIRMFEGTNVGGRVIKVNFPEVPRVGKRAKMGSNYKGYVDSPHKIYAGNLGWDMTSQDLREAFAKQKGLLSAKVIYERNTGKSRGYGFVSFETAEEVKAALIAMNGVEVQGRPLRMKLAVDDKKPLSPPVID
ncbi:RNA-binding protein CP33, chloroplastic-like [Vicia villosa]|uniref:RNA-binding protein CP33, chloroplastic-like n=1 Tax=Vicia villosa TaxID=3911 RepID=UPI00273AED81|nr:RNA-binding protein CP33, chloroplastic-like [Vicia villosa]